MPKGVYIRTEKTKRILSLAHTGDKHSKEHKRKISESLKGRKRKPFSENHRKKISESMKKYLENPEKHPNWRGGVSFESYPLEFKRIRESIRKRDNYVCQLCSKKQKQNNNERFSIHHIDYNKTNNNPKNLISLCRSCNTEVNNDRKVWMRIFRRKIRNIYKQG